MPSGSGPSSPVASGSSTAAAAAAAASSSTGSSSSRGNIVARADDATEASLQRSFAKFIADTTEATTLENAKVGLRWCGVFCVERRVIARVSDAGASNVLIRPIRAAATCASVHARV